MIKRVFKLIKKILALEVQGFYYLFLIISRGFFLIINIPFIIINKIVNSKKVNIIINKINSLQENPVISLMLVLVFSSFVLYRMYLYIPDDKMIKIDESLATDIKNKDKNTDEKTKEDEDDYNLYRKFSSYKISDINFSELRDINSDVVAWIIVDGTNINYPILKTDNNSYYLDHDINRMQTINGWTFMDYRNDSNMNDHNTIFYGHNLFNKTAFGSISNLFTDNWYNNSNHKIMVLTENNIFTYEVFSIYYSEPDSSYLKNNYNSSEKYQEFLNNLKSKSEKDFNIDITSNDRIITLSTCTDDNNGRKVVHAKLTKTE